MYASNLRRAGTATRQQRRIRSLGSVGRAPPKESQQQRSLSRGGGGARNASSSSTPPVSREGAQAAEEMWSSAKSKLAGWKVPSSSSIAGAFVLVPVMGGAWFVMVYALRQRLCEHHLQQVCVVRSNSKNVLSVSHRNFK